jgi:hypothetical protein
MARDEVVGTFPMDALGRVHVESHFCGSSMPLDHEPSWLDRHAGGRDGQRRVLSADRVGDGVVQWLRGCGICPPLRSGSPCQRAFLTPPCRGALSSLEGPSVDMLGGLQIGRMLSELHIHCG